MGGYVALASPTTMLSFYFIELHAKDNHERKQQRSKRYKVL
jgi:hypothetical protein